MRRWLVGALALVLASGVSGRAPAASITLRVDSGGALLVDNQTSLDLGAVQLLTVGATAFAFNSALPGLSLPDSAFLLDIGVPPYSVLIANSTAYGVTLVAAHSQALLGAFQFSSNVLGFEIVAGNDLLDETVFDPFGHLLVPTSVRSYRYVCGEPPCVPEQQPYFFEMTFAPEPASYGGLALVALLCVAARRGAVMRRWWLAAVPALFLALAASGSASAASTVTIYPGLPDFAGRFPVYVENSLGVPLGAVNVVVEDATGFTLNTALPGVSVPDSVYVVRPIDGVPWDALVVNNTAIGVTLVPAGATVLLGTLVASAPSVAPIILPGETIYPPEGVPVFGVSFLDASGAPLTGQIYPYCPLCEYPDYLRYTGFIVYVPEPGLSTTAGLALALQLLGGKMRRNRGSVGAPT